MTITINFNQEQFDISLYLPKCKQHSQTEVNNHMT